MEISKKIKIAIVALIILCVAGGFLVYAQWSGSISIPYTGSIPSPTPSPTPKPTPTPTPTPQSSVEVTIGSESTAQTVQLNSGTSNSATFNSVNFGTFTQNTTNFSASIPITITNTGSTDLTATLSSTTLPTGWSASLTYSNGDPFATITAGSTFPLYTTTNFSGNLNLYLPLSTPSGSLTGTATLTFTAS
jgi:hypothetical protein